MTAQDTLRIAKDGKAKSHLPMQWDNLHECAEQHPSMLQTEVEVQRGSKCEKEPCELWSLQSKLADVQVWKGSWPIVKPFHTPKQKIMGPFHAVRIWGERRILGGAGLIRACHHCCT